MELKGKTAFVTGGGSGIGAGMTEAFAEQDLKVIVADIDLASAQEQAAKLDCEALALEIDVVSLDSWAQAKNAACERFGQVDVLCNNAGISVPWRPLVDIAPEEFDRNHDDPLSPRFFRRRSDLRPSMARSASS